MTSLPGIFISRLSKNLTKLTDERVDSVGGRDCCYWGRRQILWWPIKSDRMMTTRRDPPRCFVSEPKSRKTAPLPTTTRRKRPWSEETTAAQRRNSTVSCLKCCSMIFQFNFSLVLVCPLFLFFGQSTVNFAECGQVFFFFLSFLFFNFSVTPVIGSVHVVCFLFLSLPVASVHKCLAQE